MTARAGESQGAQSFVIRTSVGFFGPADAARTTFSVRQPRARAQVYQDRAHAEWIVDNLRGDFPEATVTEGGPEA